MIKKGEANNGIQMTTEDNRNVTEFNDLVGVQES